MDPIAPAPAAPGESTAAAPPRGSAVPLFVALLGLALILFFTAVRRRVPAPLPSSAPPEVFSAERAVAALARVLGAELPHPTGSAAHTAVRTRLIAELHATGCATEEQIAWVCGPYSTCSEAHNVLVRLPGSDGGRTVLLVAHYDSVAAGPGAADDGAGVACLLEIGRALRARGPLARPVVLLFSDDEESGLNGAVAFCEHHPWAADVGAVLNLEARGSRGESRMFEVSGDNGWWLAPLRRSLAHPSTTSASEEIYRRMPNDTDLSVFIDHEVPGLNFAFIGGFAHYHTPLDDLAHLSPASVQHMGANALALVTALAEEDLSSPPAGRSVYTDILGLALVSVPEAAVLPLAAVLLVGLFLLGRNRGRGTGAGLAAVPVTVIAVALATVAVDRVVALATGHSPAGHAHPAPVRVAYGAAAVGLLAFLGRRFAARTAGSGLRRGVWLAWTLAALGTALVAPGASHLYWAPCLVALLLGAAAGSDARGTLRRTAADVLPALAASVLWLPISSDIGDALGRPAHPVAGLTCGLLASAFLPLFADTAPRTTRALAPAGLFAALFALVAAASLPTFTAESPRRLSIVYHLVHAPEEARTGTGARWALSDANGPLPPALQRAIGAPLERGFPREWLSWSAWNAPAPVSPIPAPELEVLESRRTDGTHELRLRARSARGATRLLLYVPRTQALAEIRAGGVRVPPNEGRLLDRYPTHDTFVFEDLGPEGVELELAFPHELPVELVVEDHTPGLPDVAAPLLSARPPTAVPSGLGDSTRVARRYDL